MPRNKKDSKLYLTEHFKYQIIDNIVYIYQDGNDINSEEIMVLFKKISLIIEDENISYINLSAKNIEKKKDFYQNLGFSLSYYSIDKLNKLFEGIVDKKEYRCYAFMTKNDFLNTNNREMNVNKSNIIISKNTSSNKGFISDMLLLFGGLIILCYLCVQGAIGLIK